MPTPDLDDPRLRRLIRTVLRAGLRPMLGPRVPIEMQRRWTALVTRAIAAPRLGVLRMAVDSVPCELLVPSRALPDRAIVYLHGGGYVFGSSRGHRFITARLAHLTGAPVFALDYRLAPEHPFPAAHHDVIAAYRHLLAGGRQGHQIVLAGDSAGGGLCLATAHAIRDLGLPAPAGLVLISPWLDLTLSGESMVTQAAADPLLSPKGIASYARHYCGELSREHPGCSPLFGDHRGLPPILVQVGSDELLRSDAERFAAAARDVEADIEVEYFEGLWHVFQLHAGLLPSADAALTRIAAFAERVWGAGRLSEKARDMSANAMETAAADS